MHGRYDRMVPFEVSIAILDHIADSRLVLLNNCGALAAIREAGRVGVVGAAEGTAASAQRRVLGRLAQAQLQAEVATMTTAAVLIRLVFHSAASVAVATDSST